MMTAVEIAETRRLLDMFDADLVAGGNRRAAAAYIQWPNPGRAEDEVEQINRSVAQHRLTLVEVKTLLSQHATALKYARRQETP